MWSVLRTLAAAALAAVPITLAVPLAGGVGPAFADRATAQFRIAAIREITPSCRDNPAAPVVGRVSGLIAGFPATGASFVGCFPSLAACEAWRGPVTGAITDRLILSQCAPRSGGHFALVR